MLLFIYLPCNVKCFWKKPKVFQMPVPWAEVKEREWAVGATTHNGPPSAMEIRGNKAKGNREIRRTQKIRSGWSHVQSQGKLLGHAQVRCMSALSGGFPWAPWNKKRGQVHNAGDEEWCLMVHDCESYMHLWCVWQRTGCGELGGLDGRCGWGMAA